MKLTHVVLLLACMTCCQHYAPAQVNTYILNGSATQNNCNCYTLTSETNGLSGSVWNASKIDLGTSFDFIFNVYLGCKDSTGADGIVFILQPISTNIGTSGGGMGFNGLVPSVGIALDTWQNFENDDPAFDHISIQVNGDPDHTNDLAGPIAASASSANIEDCKWHLFRITWDASTKVLRSYFDGVLRLEAPIDLVSTVFSNDPKVYWGFGAATGGSNNLQQFCTALNAGFKIAGNGDTTCFSNTPVTFINTSESFAPISTFHWDFGDGTTSSDANPPPHRYTRPGKYMAKLAITGFDGCNSDTMKREIVIGDYPIAAFSIFDTCDGKQPRIIDHSSVGVGNIANWKWELDGGNNVFSQQQSFPIDIDTGNHILKLTTVSNYGCSSSPVSQSFYVKPKPSIQILSQDGCVNVSQSFRGVQTDAATNIMNWTWEFETEKSGSGKLAQHTYQRPGSYITSLSATADNGCVSDTALFPININKAVANAGNDTVFFQHTPFQLHGSGEGTLQWSPSTGLNNPFIRNPIGILSDDQVYTLKVTTPEGCTNEDRIRIEIFKGSAIFVPTGFTPNDDGLNDLLLPGLKGIRDFGRFTVFNRWGQLVFSSRDRKEGWDGKLNGVKQANGVYVWRLQAVDFTGRAYDVKGTTTLIR